MSKEGIKKLIETIQNKTTNFQDFIIKKLCLIEEEFETKEEVISRLKDSLDSYNSICYTSDIIKAYNEHEEEIEEILEGNFFDMDMPKGFMRINDMIEKYFSEAWYYATSELLSMFEEEEEEEEIDILKEEEKEGK